MKPTIYRIEFPDGQFYIGSTVNFAERRRTHLRHGRAKKAVNPKLQAAFDANPSCNIYEVACGFAREDAHTLEALIISQEKPHLNVVLAPTPIPAKYSGAKKAWGPHKCIQDAAQALGVSYHNAKRASCKFDYAQYVELLARKTERVIYGPPDPRKRADLICILNGWHRRSDVCKVSSDTAAERRKRGWTFEDSHLVPAGGSCPTKAPPTSASKVCARYNISANTYYARRHMGWTVLEALGLKPRPEPRRPKVRKRLITAGGVTMSLNAWADKLGVKPATIHARLHSGWTEAEAVGVERRAVEVEREARKIKQESRKRSSEVYTHKGFTGTLSEICKHFGYQYSATSNRRYRGLPFDMWFIPSWHYDGVISPK